MQYKDYYGSLGVSRTASADEIQRAYRKLARKYHPDVNRSPKAEDRFKEISEAYEVLKDSEKRSTYDRFGSSWNGRRGPAGASPGFENINFDFGSGGGGGGAGASGFSSFFDMLFGRGGRGGNPFGGAGGPFGGANFGGQGGGEEVGWDMRGSDQEARLVLSLEEAALGGPREVTISDPTSGRTKTYSVTLPKGVRKGQKIRLAGRGGQGSGGGQAGDLYLKVEIRPHERLRLDGLDLHTHVLVTPWAAALGGDALVKTLDGSLKVRVPAGSSSGRRIRLRGKGFPSPKGASGDLYAEIRIVVPETLSEKEQSLFEQLAETSSFKPR